MSPGKVFSFGPFRFHPQQRRLERDGAQVPLPPGDAGLLTALLDAGGAAVSLQQLRPLVQQHADASQGLDELSASLNRVLLAGSHLHYVARLGGGRYLLMGEIGRRGHLRDDHAPGRLPDLECTPIGREAALRAGLSRVQEHRLVTVVGPGGVGKTTLAIALAQEAAAAFDDGVRFVDLARLTSSAAVAGAVLISLGWDARSGARGDTQVESLLLRVLEGRRMLLVLDNCEHVVDAASSVAELLLQSEGVRVLATSREPLRAAGEALIQLQPMDLPLPDATLCTDDVDRYSALRFFLSRAFGGGRPLPLDSRELQDAARICRRLDGLPLALELAAAHVPALGLQGLLSQLAGRPDLPGQVPGKSQIARHRTIEAVLDWSYRLLEADERSSLHRLAVFRGDIPQASALRVLAVGLDDARALAALMGLQGKSMLAVRMIDGAAHCRLLETTRTYALPHLDGDSAGPAVREAHARDCKERLQRADADWDHMTAMRWMACHGPLIDDVRAALDWAFGEGGPAQLGVELLVAAFPLSGRLALNEEFMRRMRYAIDCVSGTGDADMRLKLRLFVALRSLALNARMSFGGRYGSDEQILRLARAMPDEPSRLTAWISLWHGAMQRGDYAQATVEATRWMACAKGCADPIEEIDARRAMAYALHFRGDLEGAKSVANQVLAQVSSAPRSAVAKPSAVDPFVSMSIVLARTHWIEGRPREASATAWEALRRAEEDGPLAACLVLSLALCPVVFWSGDLDSAYELVPRLRVTASRISPGAHEEWADWFEFLLEHPRGAAREKEPAHLPSPVGMHADMLVTMDCPWALESTMRRIAEGVVGWCSPEALRMRGEAALRQVNEGEARSFYLQAMALARENRQRAWELRAALSLARLEISQGRAGEVGRWLGPLRSGVVEPAATADERSANALLAAAGRA